MTDPEIHGTHTSPDEPDHLAAFLAQQPEVGDLFTDREKQPYFVVSDGIGRVVADKDLMLMNAVGEWCDPADVCEFDGPLTRARIVSADEHPPGTVLVDKDGDEWTVMPATARLTREAGSYVIDGGAIVPIYKIDARYSPLTVLAKTPGTGA